MRAEPGVACSETKFPAGVATSLPSAYSASAARISTEDLAAEAVADTVAATAQAARRLLLSRIV
jgi:hypothetical protein